MDQVYENLAADQVRGFLSINENSVVDRESTKVFDSFKIEKGR